MPLSSSGTSAIAANEGFSAARPSSRRLRPREFLVVERERAVFVVDGHQALLEVAALDRGVGALLALQRQRVDVLRGDAFQRRDGVGADALVGLRMAVRAGADCRCRSSAGRSAAAAFGIDIISVPPAMTRSSMPAMIEAAAMFTAVMPEPQKRSSVTPLARTS